MIAQDKPKKSQSITLRLDSYIIDELQLEANRNQISLNALVNQVLKRYSNGDRYENRVGMIPVSKAMLSSLIDNTIDMIGMNGIREEDMVYMRYETMKQAAEVGFNIMKDAVLFMKKQYNIWVVLAVLQDYMKVSGINSDHRIEGGRKHVFVIQHELVTLYKGITKIDI